MERSVRDAAQGRAAGFGVVSKIEPYRPWGRMIVAAVSVGDGRTPAVLKAAAERDVRAERLAAASVRTNSSGAVSEPEGAVRGIGEGWPGK
jgi:hypothetical protein